MSKSTIYILADTLYSGNSIGRNKTLDHASIPIQFTISVEKSCESLIFTNTVRSRTSVAVAYRTAWLIKLWKNFVPSSSVLCENQFSPPCILWGRPFSPPQINPVTSSRRFGPRAAAARSLSGRCRPPGPAPPRSRQGCGSALIWVAGSGSRRAKITQKKYRIFMFWSAGCSLLRAQGFSCSLGVLYGGLGRSKLQFLIKKIKK